MINYGIIIPGGKIKHHFPFAELSTLELWLPAMIPWLRLLKSKILVKTRPVHHGLNLLLTILKMMREQMNAVKEMRAETFNQGNGSSSSSFAPLMKTI